MSVYKHSWRKCPSTVPLSNDPNLNYAKLYCKWIASERFHTNTPTINYSLVGGFNHLKNISQIGSFPQVGVKMKNIWNHHPVVLVSPNIFQISPPQRWTTMPRHTTSWSASVPSAASRSGKRNTWSSWPKTSRLGLGELLPQTPELIRTTWSLLCMFCCSVLFWGEGVGDGFDMIWLLHQHFFAKWELNLTTKQIEFAEFA